MRQERRFALCAVWLNLPKYVHVSAAAAESQALRLLTTKMGSRTVHFLFLLHVKHHLARHGSDDIP